VAQQQVEKEQEPPRAVSEMRCGRLDQDAMADEKRDTLVALTPHTPPLRKDNFAVSLVERPLHSGDQVPLTDFG
jgi:hypothetical protein